MKLLQEGDNLINNNKKEYFIRKLRAWGKINYQTYPWREEKNIYRILLTEICLQKTDSKKIKAVYPLIQQLDNPEEAFENQGILDEIFSRIGLSYKKDRLLTLSSQLLNNFKSKVPDNYNDLISLYGVGDYIANAVLSFGFKKRAAVVDTNTIRILESFFGIRSTRKRPREDRTLNEVLLALLPPRNHVLFNYYLLDFGARLCVHSKKHCCDCLLKKKCKYYIIKSK